MSASYELQRINVFPNLELKQILTKVIRSCLAQHVGAIVLLH